MALLPSVFDLTDGYMIQTGFISITRAEGANHASVTFEKAFTNINTVAIALGANLANADATAAEMTQKYRYGYHNLSNTGFDAILYVEGSGYSGTTTIRYIAIGK